MDTAIYIAVGLILALAALCVFSTVRFNRKKPMTREEYERYEEEKKRDE